MNKPSDFLAFYNGLDRDKRSVIERRTSLVEFSKGTTIFEQGTIADAVYAIEKGVVEVILSTSDHATPRTVAYLSRGDIFGEMGVITGQPRISTVRVCEDVTLRRFPREKFLPLLERIPAFGVFLTQNLAARLYRSTSDHYYMSYGVDFSGNTENFDMLIIFQTLQSSGRTGELQITNGNNDVVGRFFFRNGNVEFAQYLHLSGVEAVWQLFLEEKLCGTFAFQISEQPIFTYEEKHHIALQGMDLLMQAAAKRDIYQMLAPSSRDLNRVLSRLVDDLAWTDGETEAAATVIWKLIRKRAQTLGTIWRLSNLSVMTIIEVSRQMRELKLAELSKVE